MEISKLKVLELASVLAGPSVGMFFSELGAQVIKIENKKSKGDVTRSWRLPQETPQSPTSAYYSSVNWNKEVIFLDFLNDVDFQKLKKLISETDIVISNFKMGDAEKFNLTHRQIKRLNPNIVHGCINGYGEGIARTAFDVVLQAETGFMSMTGTKKSGPIKMPVALIDLMAAHQLKEGILIALLENVKPAKVQVSLYDTAIASLANQASNYLMTGHIAEAMGTQHPNIAPYGDLYSTLDEKQIVLAVGNDHQFAKLCGFLGIKMNSKFKDNQSRVRNRKELNDLLSDVIIQRKQQNILENLEKINVPCGGVLTIDEVFENPAAKKLILEEMADGFLTKRVKTTVFRIKSD